MSLHQQIVVVGASVDDVHTHSIQAPSFLIEEIVASTDVHYVHDGNALGNGV